MEINNRKLASATLSLFVIFFSLLAVGKTNFHGTAGRITTPRTAAADTTVRDTTIKDTTRIEANATNDSIKEPSKSYRTMGRHKATWYRTDRHPRVHRPHPTAAYNFAPIGSMLLVTNTVNNKSCLVMVTDRMGNRKSNHIDLSHNAFGLLAEHATGTISVDVKILD